jgi:hypothetical protein
VLDDRTRELLVALLYPVQFDSRPELGVTRVMNRIVKRGALGAAPGDYFRAIDAALQTNDTELAEIIPHSHDGATVRSYLQHLSQSFAIAQASHEAASSRAFDAR